MPDALSSVATSLAGALRPLASALAAADDTLPELARELGYELPSVPPSLAALKGSGDRLTESLDAVSDAAIALAN